MATLRAAPTQPGTPWCLKKEQPEKKGEMEPPTPTTPSTKCSSCIEKQAHLPNERQLTVRATPKTAVQAPSNSVLNSTAMEKELWMANSKDTQCQAK